MKTANATTRVLLALALITITLGAGLSEAEEERGKGLFIGVNAGFGSGALHFKSPLGDVTDDSVDGALGALRFGYAFSPKFALSLEGYGFGATSDNEDDWGLGAGLLAVTWHPCGHGLFLRVGVGGGGGDFIHPVTGLKTTIEDRGAGMFSLGYNWWLGDNTTLGLAFDGFVLDAGDAIGFEDDAVGAHGLTLQFNWYL